VKVESFLTEAAAQLRQVTDDPALEARLLAAHVTGRPSGWVLAHPEMKLSSDQVAGLHGLLERRLRGEPLPYLLGHWEFFGLEFDLTPDVLIPRPETELLVETAIACGQRQPTVRAVDVGTGSGCIAIALAVHCPSLSLTATDISPAALRVAQRNAHKHAVAERIEFVECDLFPDGPLGFDLILSNPPYIPTQIMKQTAVFGNEPTLALDGGESGLEIISRLLEQATGRLVPGGMMLIEIESSLGAAVLSAAHEQFPRAKVEIRKDLLGLDRLLVVQT
jgi:release factor glutamine methyltransferase